MALVDPYSPCPCGSGQKFKWCCHKVEAVAERAQRLFESGQIESAAQTLDEGLRKEPGNAWLLTRKALYLTRSGQPEPAKNAVADVLARNPRHAGAQMLMTRLVLETEGPAAGVAQLQRSLTALPSDLRKTLWGLVKVVGAYLVEASEFPAALRHLRLAQSLDPSAEPDPAISSTLRSIESNPAISPLLKNPDSLSPAPESLSGDARRRFDEALQWANEGQWASAAAAFETLSTDPVAGPQADRNQGFCRLWLADLDAAVAALRRYSAWLGTTTEAVDIEALCQQIPATPGDVQVEHVQLVWPIRDRQALLETLRADPSIHAEDPAPIDPEEPNAVDVDQFTMLDRPEIVNAPADLKVDDIPRIVGRVFVGPESVALETFDDGRLDRLADRFTSLVGRAIPPAHPKTKIVGKVSRFHLALMWEWLLPDDLDEETSERLSREQARSIIQDVWPETPNPYLNGRTPLRAAADGDAEVPLRAAVFQFALSRESSNEGFDFSDLRSRLKIPAEPAIDPATVDIMSVPISRLSLVPADRLDDESLVRLYALGRRFALQAVIRAATLALIARPEVFEKVGIEPITVYTDLAALASSNGNQAEAFDWIRRGREADTPAQRARNAPLWDMFEIRLRARSDDPAAWVPDLAVLLDRHRDDSQVMQTLMMSLVDMGLLEMVNSPDRPGEILLDSRPLQALMAEFGPRVTTSTGRLGVSATKPEIWTPGGGSTGAGSASPGSSGGLWTPGGGGGTTSSPEGPSGGEKRLILPGR